MKIPDLFPKGTSLADMPGKSYAKPEIWDHFDDFKAAAAVLATEAGKLADAAKSGDMAAFAAQYDIDGREGLRRLPHPVPPEEILTLTASALATRAGLANGPGPLPLRGAIRR